MFFLVTLRADTSKLKLLEQLDKKPALHAVIQLAGKYIKQLTV